MTVGLHELVDHICGGPRNWRMDVIVARHPLNGWCMLFILPEDIAVLMFDEAEGLARALIKAPTIQDTWATREMARIGCQIAAGVARGRAHARGGSIH